MAKTFQFRLRTLLLAVVPVAVVALPLGYYVRRPVPIHVTGTVTLNGTPLDYGLVSFFSNDSDETFSNDIWTDVAGRFNLYVIPGRYSVAIDKHIEAVDTFAVRIERLTPRHWANKETSGLNAEVTKHGSNNFTFNLTGVVKESEE